MNENKIYCYIRISTDKQEFERQENILKERGYINNVNCEYITEIYTGTTTKRPLFDNLINNLLKEGDTLVTSELSRISRSVKDFNNLIDLILHKKKVNIIILKENFNLQANGRMDAMTKLILHITSAFAEFERDIISDRTRESLKAKKLNGTKSGRPIGRVYKDTTTRERFFEVLKYMIDNNIGQDRACYRLHFPNNTFKKWLAELYKKHGTKDYKKIYESEGLSK